MMPDRRDIALEKEEHMTEVHILAIDLAKRSFQVCATAAGGAVQCLDTTGTRAEPKAGDDTICELNLTRSRRLQSCDLSVRQTYFVRHMHLLP